MLRQLAALCKGLCERLREATRVALQRCARMWNTHFPTLLAALREAIRPPAGVLAALVGLSIVGLLWCFLLGGRETPLSYGIYVVSAYALVVLTVWVVPICRRGWLRMRGNRHVARLIESEALRAGASGAWSAFSDLAYAVFTLATGLIYDFAWAFAISLYHIIVAGMGLALATGFQRARRFDDARRETFELSMVRNAGVLLLLMALALTGVMVLMVKYHQPRAFDRVVVIANAAFVFLSLAIVTRNALLVRRASRPSFYASRAVALSRVLVQLFFLETMMIDTFGAGAERFRIAMEGVTGAVILLMVCATAVSLILYARHARRAGFRETKGETDPR